MKPLGVKIVNKLQRFLYYILMAPLRLAKTAANSRQILKSLCASILNF